MNPTSCDNCGAGLIAGANFCRQCGRPIPAVEGASVTEGTTRLLETPMTESEKPPAQNYRTFDPAPLAARGNERQSLAQTLPPAEAHARDRKILWLTLLASGVLVLLFGALVAFWFAAQSARTTVVPPVAVGAPIAPPVAPPAAPAPPAPPPAVAPSGFVYPNAKVEQTIMVSGEPQMTRLRTNDAFGDVVKWYESNFDIDEKVISAGSNAVLNFDSTTIIVTAEGASTSIMITSE